MIIPTFHEILSTGLLPYSKRSELFHELLTSSYAPFLQRFFHAWKKYSKNVQKRIFKLYNQVLCLVKK